MKINIPELAMLELEREGKLNKRGWVNEFFKRINTIEKYLSRSDRKKVRIKS